MEELKPNNILKFNDNQLCEVRKVLGYEDVNKLKQDIDQLDDWIKKQNHFRIKEFDKGYLERILIYNKGSIERAKQKLDKLCTFTNLMPDFLQNYDIRNEFTTLFNVTNICVLPQPSKDNYRIVIANANGIDDNGFSCLQYYRYYLVLAHYMLNNDYCHGYEVVADTRNLTIGTLVKMNPIIVHKGLILIVDAMGNRVKKIHLISGYKLFDSIVTLFRQGLTAKLKERIVIHPNVERLHNHFPREQLPKELGGDSKTMKELSALTFKELSSDSNIAKIKFMEGAGTDESRRLVCKFNEEYSGMPGSFKTLCVD